MGVECQGPCGRDFGRSEQVRNVVALWALFDDLLESFLSNNSESEPLVGNSKSGKLHIDATILSSRL